MLLAIDTCGASGGVALGVYGTGQGGEFDSPTVLSKELVGKTFSELLLSTVAEMLASADASVNQLAGVVAIHGPGSFTGIRIGVSAAKGLAEGLSIPLIAISRLELLARKAAGSVVAVLDAGRDEFYAGFYRDGVREDESLLTRGALVDAIRDSGRRVIVCEERVREALADFSPEFVAAPTAADALALGALRFRSGAFDDVATLEANYLRRSESEMLARIAEHAALKAAAQPATAVE